MRSPPLSVWTSALSLIVILGGGGCKGAVARTASSASAIEEIPIAPPSDLTYSTNPATFAKGETIENDVPSSSGGGVASYAITPGLPAGLVLNKTTGVVSGTPKAIAARKTYTVTATNAAGSTSVALVITVSDFAGACRVDSDCKYGSAPYCSCLGGAAGPCQCTSNCSTASDCGAGYACATAMSSLPDGGSLNACVQKCSSSAGCSAGFACNQTQTVLSALADGGVTQTDATTCALGCDLDEDCASGLCDVTTGSCSSGAIPDAGVPSTADAGTPAVHHDSCSAYTPPTECTEMQQSAAVAAMENAAIGLPGRAGGLDLQQDGGLFISEVVATECQGTARGDVFYDGKQVMAFGANDAVVAEYDPCTGAVDYLAIELGHGGEDSGSGYLGALSATSRDGSTTYKIPLNAPMEMTKDGVTTPVAINWRKAYAGTAADVKVFDEIYRAIMATYLPAAQAEPAGETCVSNGGCVIYSFSSPPTAYFEIQALGWTAWNFQVDDTTKSQQIQRMDLYPAGQG